MVDASIGRIISRRFLREKEKPKRSALLDEVSVCLDDNCETGTTVEQEWLMEGSS